MEESFQKLAETEPNSLRGASVTSYGLQPVHYIGEIVDAAKLEMHFINWVDEVTAPKGSHQVSVSKKSQYRGYNGSTFNTAGSDIGGSGAGTGPYANTLADISWETISNLTNVTVQPLPVILGAAIQRYGLDTNAVNVLESVKMDLAHDMACYIEYDIATKLGDATNSTSTALGAQTLFGGDATSSATLAAGDILTTDIIAKAIRKLKDRQFGYRASGAYGAETLVSISSYQKNPWQNTANEPFVLFIGPAQAEAIMKDSQFVNASEYGDNTVIKNGEVGKIRYLGVRIVETNFVERTAASGTAPDGQTAAVACTQCLLIKGKKALTVAYAKRPELKVWDYNEREEVRLSLTMYYASVVVHTDAIIKILVADA